MKTLKCAILSLFIGIVGNLAQSAEDVKTHKIESAFKVPNSKVEVKKVPVRMWTSRDGGKTQENVIKEVDIGGLYFDNLIAYDIQYESVLKFRGLKLRDLISQYKPIPDGFDFILLHSTRGMIIPVSIASLRNDTEVFIALAYFDETTKKWSTNFSSGVYSQEGEKEKISVPFINNKMVVGSNWRHTDFSITPWRFFDSLAGIELVSSANYYDALKSGGITSEISGRSTYMRRCQYCHGLDNFGAKFAPNFLKIIGENQRDATKMLLNKVLPPEGQSKLQKLSRMPKQPDFTKREAEDLVHWISAFRKSKHPK